MKALQSRILFSMSTPKMILTDKKYFYTAEDFHWSKLWSGTGKEALELSKLQECWDAALEAGSFAYKLHHVEGRIVPGKYGVFVQLNEMRFNKRRKPETINSISQPFNHDKFNFTKVHRKEVLFALCPEDFPRETTAEDEQHLMIINVSPMEYGHCLLIPSVWSCLPQVLTEDALLLALEISMLSNHRGFHVGFNSLCAHASVNHLHFHTWYSEHPSYLETADVSLVCGNVFEVKDYPTTAFVFELAPGTDVGLVARTIHKVSSYFIQEEVAHNLHIIRGARCRPSNQRNGITQGDRDVCSVLRVFLWPRNPVHGAKELSSYESEKRPIAVYEFAGSLAIETRKTYESFTEEKFVEYMARATLPEEEFIRHREAIRELLHT
ncbi:GDP-D-glucose phosphorylase 1-like isoform X2 [Pocillopora damicornis]|uniref:GDP-D-glucose phosphorylase 1-like isoform X2 n=1 Tax=Pocillopora damicornis TaxID=46731 RepID=UPI000F54ECB8|nr:GDP-D-glucose phosphorylase 1-like isoform X2 [Pocillopora damicornis]